MTEPETFSCIRCGTSGETEHLELCSICHRYFCSACGHRAGYGRTFCSPVCGHAYYDPGDTDDDQESGYDD